MKKNILVQAPVFSISGYGAHARDIVISLINDARWNVSVIPVGWGGTSTTEHLSEDSFKPLAFGCNNKLDDKAERIWMQVGIPNEFERNGNFNIGITAGLEATAISDQWVGGCNKMDLIIVPTHFTRDTFLRD